MTFQNFHGKYFSVTLIGRTIPVAFVTFSGLWKSVDFMIDCIVPLYLYMVNIKMVNLSVLLNRIL